MQAVELPALLPSSPGPTQVACYQVEPTHPFYWQEVARRVGGVTASECCAAHHASPPSTAGGRGAAAGRGSGSSRPSAVRLPGLKVGDDWEVGVWRRADAHPAQPGGVGAAAWVALMAACPHNSWSLATSRHARPIQGLQPTSACLCPDSVAAAVAAVAGLGCGRGQRQAAHSGCRPQTGAAAAAAGPAGPAGSSWRRRARWRGSRWWWRSGWWWQRRGRAGAG